MSRRIALASLWIGVGAWYAPVHAVPRYTARYEQKCGLCHVNPTGGGMRTAYATQQLVPEEIALSPARPQALKEIEPMIGKHLLIGADFREFYIRSNVPADTLDFFQMQGDLYLGFQLSPKLTLYYDRGQSDSYELFGTGYLHPSFYLKGGRFVPSYGWKFDDHTMYVRSELGLQPPGNSDAGIEAGYSREHFDAQLGLVNGSRGSNPDTDNHLGEVLNLVWRYHVGPLGGAIGGSGYHNSTPIEEYGSAGLYGYLTFHRLTWLGEYDRVRRRNAAGTTQDSVVTSHELSWLLRKGLELKATYDAFDPDRDLESGSKSRFGGGVFVMPWSYAAFEALVRSTRYHDGVAYSGQGYTETVLQLHLLF